LNGFSGSPSKLVQHEIIDNIPPDDDEHRLIARYTARLAADSNNAVSFQFFFHHSLSRALGRCVDSMVVRIDPLCFLAGCRKRQLNQALSIFVLVQYSFYPHDA